MCCNLLNIKCWNIFNFVVKCTIALNKITACYCLYFVIVAGILFVASSLGLCHPDDADVIRVGGLLISFLFVLFKIDLFTHIILSIQAPVCYVDYFCHLMC